jgi:hypothetical protein
MSRSGVGGLGGVVAGGLALAALLAGAPREGAADSVPPFRGLQLGSARAVATGSGLVLLGEGHRVTVLADDGGLSFRARSGELGGMVRDIEVIGGFAYVSADAGGLTVLALPDLAPAPVPRPLGDVVVRGVSLSGEAAWVASPARGVVELDVSDPGRARELGGHSLAPMDPSDAGLGLRDALRLNNKVFVTGRLGTLALDLSTRQPMAVGDHGLLGYERLVAFDRRTFLVGRTRVPAYDSNLRQRHEILLDSESTGTATLGNRLYLAQADGWINGYEADDATFTLRPRTTFRPPFYSGPLASSAEGLLALDPRLELALLAPGVDGRRGVRASHTVLGGDGDLVVSGDTAVVVQSVGPKALPGAEQALAVVDVRDAGAVALRGRFALPEPALGFALRGDFVYVSLDVPIFRSQLLTLSIADPAAPRVVATQDGLPRLEHLRIAGDLLLAADTVGSMLLLFELTGSGQPQLVSRLALESPATAVVLSWPLAYVALESNRFVVVDFKDPAAPQVRGEARFSHAVKALSDPDDGGYLYALGEQGELARLDVADPSSPRLGPWSPMALMPRFGLQALQLAGKSLLLATAAGAEVVDVSGSTPRRAGLLAPWPAPAAVAVDEAAGRWYALWPEDGLGVFGTEVLPYLTPTPTPPPPTASGTPTRPEPSATTSPTAPMPGPVPTETPRPGPVLLPLAVGGPPPGLGFGGTGSD